MDILTSDETKSQDKYFKICYQSNFLKNLGIPIENETILNYGGGIDITNYLNFINQEEIKKYIPSKELIEYTSSIREKKYEEALREYYTTREDFKAIIDNIGNHQNNQEAVYRLIKDKSICIWGTGGTNQKGEFISIMSFTIRIGSRGILAHSFIHECGHAIDQNSKTQMGLEGNLNSDEIPKNPYDNAFRKYEKINETLDDIFTIEVINILHQQGIYLIEPKEVTSLDTSNDNTNSIIKNLLQPLLQKFRAQVIKAKVTATPKELTKYIGEENYEDLVDIVNKVDNLIRKGLNNKIKKSPEDPMVIEYQETLEKLKQVYINIDDYYEHNKEFIELNEEEELTNTR